MPSTIDFSCHLQLAICWIHAHCENVVSVQKSRNMDRCQQKLTIKFSTLFTTSDTDFMHLKVYLPVNVYLPVQFSVLWEWNYQFTVWCIVTNVWNYHVPVQSPRWDTHHTILLFLRIFFQVYPIWEHFSLKNKRLFWLKNLLFGGTEHFPPKMYTFESKILAYVQFCMRDGPIIGYVIFLASLTSIYIMSLHKHGSQYSLLFKC